MHAVREGTAKSTTSGTSLLRHFTGGESRTGGESFPFCQDIHHHSSTYVLSFSVTLDPNEGMPDPPRRNVLLRHHAHPCLPFNVHLWPYIYAWGSIYTTSIFKTSTEVLYVGLQVPSSNMQSCLFFLFYVFLFVFSFFFSTWEVVPSVCIFFVFWQHTTHMFVFSFFFSTWDAGNCLSRGLGDVYKRQDMQETTAYS